MRWGVYGSSSWAACCLGVFGPGSDNAVRRCEAGNCCWRCCCWCPQVCACQPPVQARPHAAAWSGVAAALQLVACIEVALGRTYAVNLSNCMERVRLQQVLGTIRDRWVGHSAFRCEGRDAGTASVGGLCSSHPHHVQVASMLQDQLQHVSRLLLA
jgi:hypothetical protein